MTELYLQGLNGYERTNLKSQIELSQEQEERNSENVYVVSNRLPFSVKNVDGRFVGKQSAGRLVTAMEPLLTGSVKRGVWIGWTGEYARNTEEREGIAEVCRSASTEKSYDVVPVDLTP